MVLSNVGSIVLSLPSASVTAYSGSSGAAALQVKALAISNTVTRLLTGPIADFVSPVVISEPPSPRKHYISRAVFLVVPAVVLALTSLWMEVAVRSQADLWVLRYAKLLGMFSRVDFDVAVSVRAWRMEQHSLSCSCACQYDSLNLLMSLGPAL
jgi:hypothetical protein